MHLVFYQNSRFVCFFVLSDDEGGPATVEPITIEEVAIAGQCLLAVKIHAHCQVIQVTSLAT
jgi:hypothetical protein